MSLTVAVFPVGITKGTMLDFFFVTKCMTT